MTDSWREIRPVAVGVPRRGDEILLAEHHDSVAEETFYRPVGGGMAFGESSEETVVRELREELEVTVTDARQVATRERTFEFEGERGHEIWFLYEIEIAEDWPYEREEFTAYEPELDFEFRVCWLSNDELDESIVYPEDLTELL